MIYFLKPETESSLNPKQLPFHEEKMRMETRARSLSMFPTKKSGNKVLPQPKGKGCRGNQTADEERVTHAFILGSWLRVTRRHSTGPHWPTPHKLVRQVPRTVCQTSTVSVFRVCISETSATRCLLNIHRCLSSVGASLRQAPHTIC